MNKELPTPDQTFDAAAAPLVEAVVPEPDNQEVRLAVVASEAAKQVRATPCCGACG